ncbi:YciI family protein [Fimbriimonas ginsengisoli]|nr:YciI family protein [Fimbriimonas ginsengisoli]
MLLIRGEGEWDKMSPAQMEETIKKYSAWAKRLREEGRLLDAEPLDRAGRVLVGVDGVITDGPFMETKEMIGGYYIYNAADLEEAVAIGRDCPTLAYGGAIEIRPIADYS